MINQSIQRINEIASADEHNSMHLCDLLMIDFDFDDLNRCISLDDDRIAAELAEIAHNDDLNAESLPNAFRASNAAFQRDAAEMLNLLMTLDRDSISQLRLADSLCPMHACDYAICFDDDDDECAQIRMTFPSHDT